jgi:hypothetical protein
MAQGIVDRVFERLQRILLRAAVAALGLILAATLGGWFLLSRRRRRVTPAPAIRPTLREREA